MNILIIEDEVCNVQLLENRLKQVSDELQVVGRTSSIQESIAFLREDRDIDIIFADICLDDGLSFSIFDQIMPEAMIVFMTAYNGYIQQALDYHCLDYLVKPVRTVDLEVVLAKYDRVRKIKALIPPSSSFWQNMTDTLLQPKLLYRSRILLKRGQDEIIREVSDIVFAQVDNGIVRVFLRDGDWGDYPGPLQEMVDSLSHDHFIRINRQSVISLEFVDRVVPGIGRDSQVILKKPYDERSFSISANSKKKLYSRLDIN